MPAAPAKVPAVFRRPPSGIDAQHPINALELLPPHGDPSSVLTAPAKFWVQHSLYPTIKKACGTKDAPGIRKQNASRVLSELRQARAVVEDQLEDFHRGMVELDAWIASTSQQSATPMPDATTTTEGREEHPRRKKKRRRKLSTSSALSGDMSKDLAPSFDVDAMDLDTPCTTTECWQYLRACSFFQPVHPDSIDRVLPAPPSTGAVADERNVVADNPDNKHPIHDMAPSTQTTDSLSEKLLAALVDVHGPSPTTSMPDEGDDNDSRIQPEATTIGKQLLAHNTISVLPSLPSPPISYIPSSCFDVSASKMHHELAVVGLVDHRAAASDPLAAATDNAIGDEDVCMNLHDVFDGATDVASRLAHLEKTCAAHERSTTAIKASLRQHILAYMMDHPTDPTTHHRMILDQYRKLCKRKADDARRKLRRTLKAMSTRKQVAAPLDHGPTSAPSSAINVSHHSHRDTCSRNSTAIG
ncbi:hypothetical protein H310_13682 [Aphanomyces invadans]|uniref:Uncharacterized protein n=1 Tax=Aphanomyces invadans TaxID=157072 RepID=A0A024TCT6_9STRA|nr:hypothetical protein H310_13682 [Aphanomyces invadans]ETV91863.1 hypothetical protein H310_13682 [Aphanomyces invadans]|eukprot:XP_008879500.1 hypothetical protein H310_13682 [Aphanomyces invadans]